MSTPLRLRYLLALAVVFGLCADPVWSVTPVVQPMAYTVTTYAATGTLASISPTKHTLTISGTEYRYPVTLRVWSASGESVSVQAISPGQSVAYTVDAGSMLGQPSVTEIRIIAGPGRER